MFVITISSKVVKTIIAFVGTYITCVKYENFVLSLIATCNHYYCHVVYNVCPKKLIMSCIKDMVGLLSRILQLVTFQSLQLCDNMPLKGVMCQNCYQKVQLHCKSFKRVRNFPYELQVQFWI